MCYECIACSMSAENDHNEDTTEEWEEWNATVTFQFTYVDEGPFPIDMPEEERREKVIEQFWENAWDEFYQAYNSIYDLENKLEVSEVEPYE